MRLLRYRGNLPTHCFTVSARAGATSENSSDSVNYYSLRAAHSSRPGFQHYYIVSSSGKLSPDFWRYPLLHFHEPTNCGLETRDFYGLLDIHAVIQDVNDHLLTSLGNPMTSRCSDALEEVPVLEHMGRRGTPFQKTSWSTISGLYSGRHQIKSVRHVVQEYARISNCYAGSATGTQTLSKGNNNLIPIVVPPTMAYRQGQEQARWRRRSLGSQTHAGAIIQPQPSSLGQSRRHLQLLQSPYLLHPLVVHIPSRWLQQRCHPPMDVPAVLTCQPYYLAPRPRLL